MGKIFSSAETVYAWLGDSDADSDYVFDGVNDLIGEDRICCVQVEMEVTDCLFQQNYGGKD
jgi:hypothetical protein